jgi:hypothetical protein
MDRVAGVELHLAASIGRNGESRALDHLGGDVDAEDRGGAGPCGESGHIALPASQIEDVGSIEWAELSNDEGPGREVAQQDRLFAAPACGVDVVDGFGGAVAGHQGTACAAAGFWARARRQSQKVVRSWSAKAEE